MYTDLVYGETTLTDNKVDKPKSISYVSRRTIIRNKIRDEEKTYPAINDERRADWDRNHVKIKRVIREFVRQGGRFSNWEIAVASRLSECTVKKHVREIDIDELYYRERMRTNRANVELFKRLARASKAGSMKATELGLYIFVGYNDKDPNVFNSRWKRRQIGSLHRFYLRRKWEELIDIQLDYWGYPSEWTITGRPTFERGHYLGYDERESIKRRLDDPRYYKTDS